jgi:hypothetical protein
MGSEISIKEYRNRRIFMQKFDDIARTGDTLMTPSGEVIRHAIVQVRDNKRKEVVAFNKNYNYDASRCKPVYIDEV